MDEATVRNVRSKCRCSCVLQFTFRRAVSCVLHRPPSQVIHCTVLFFSAIHLFTGKLVLKNSNSFTSPHRERAPTFVTRAEAKSSLDGLGIISSRSVNLGVPYLAPRPPAGRETSTAKNSAHSRCDSRPQTGDRRKEMYFPGKREGLLPPRPRNFSRKKVFVLSDFDHN